MLIFILIMKPIVYNQVEENGVLSFTLKDVNVSIANALRRIILSEIPIYVFRTIPYHKSKVHFDINTSRMNNELIKQRLSCVPIHIKDKDFPYKDHVLEVDVENVSDEIIYVTTADFRVKNITNDKYLSEAECRKIFPPDTYTGQFIDFIRLRPKLSDDAVGEHLKFTCGFDIGTAKEDGAFNAVSTSSYGYTPDPSAIKSAWKEKEKELKSNGMKADEIENKKKDWMLLDAMRFTFRDSYDFTIETIGIYDNIELVKMGCVLMKQKLAKFMDLIQSEPQLIKSAMVTLENAYDIILEKEDYTLGKVLEYYLYHEFYITTRVLSYCGFRKPHPHIDLSIIRVAFIDDPHSTAGVLPYIIKSLENSITMYDKILDEFKD